MCFWIKLLYEAENSSRNLYLMDATSESFFKGAVPQ